MEKNPIVSSEEFLVTDIESRSHRFPNGFASDSAPTKTAVVWEALESVAPKRPKSVTNDG